MERSRSALENKISSCTALVRRLKSKVHDSYKYKLCRQRCTANSDAYVGHMIDAFLKQMNIAQTVNTAILWCASAALALLTKSV